MQVQAISRNVRISPRKVRLVADAIRRMPVDSALVSLQMIRKRAALAIAKTMKSAIANALHNANIDQSKLKILNIEIAEGQALKRYHPSTRGRIHPYKKRSSHIRVILEEVKEEMKKEDKQEKKEVKQLRA